MATIYICGDDSHETEPGIEPEKIKSRLKALNCKVITPTESEFEWMNWADTLQNRVELLKRSNAVYVLPNWRRCTMSRILLTVAMDMKIQTIFHPASKKEIKQFITTLDS
jgi:hypothetical protein